MVDGREAQAHNQCAWDLLIIRPLTTDLRITAYNITVLFVILKTNQSLQMNCYLLCHVLRIAQLQLTCHQYLDIGSKQVKLVYNLLLLKDKIKLTPPPSCPFTLSLPLILHLPALSTFFLSPSLSSDSYLVLLSLSFTLSLS